MTGFTVTWNAIFPAPMQYCVLIESDGQLPLTVDSTLFTVDSTNITGDQTTTAGAPVTVEFNTTSNSFVVTGLTAGTEYTVRVVAKCTTNKC